MIKIKNTLNVIKNLIVRFFLNYMFLVTFLVLKEKNKTKEKIFVFLYIPY